MTSRYQQNTYTVIFKSGHVLEQYPKIKFRVRQSIRWLKHVPCLYYSLLVFSCSCNFQTFFFFFFAFPCCFRIKHFVQLLLRLFPSIITPINGNYSFFNTNHLAWVSEKTENNLSNLLLGLVRHYKWHACDFSEKGQKKAAKCLKRTKNDKNLKTGATISKFENILEKGRRLCAIIVRNKLVEKALVCGVNSISSDDVNFNRSVLWNKTHGEHRWRYIKRFLARPYAGITYFLY